MAGRKGRSGGRNRKPTALKVIEGTDRPDRANPNEPKAPPGDVSEPPELAGYALECWRDLAPLLTEMGLLDLSSARMLVALCEAYADWREAVDDIAAKGAYYEVNERQLSRPAVGVREKAWRRYHLGLTEFGLTPASRARVEAKPTAAKGNPMERYGLG